MHRSKSKTKTWKEICSLFAKIDRPISARFLAKQLKRKKKEINAELYRATKDAEDEKAFSLLLVPLSFSQNKEKKEKDKEEHQVPYWILTFEKKQMFVYVFVDGKDGVFSGCTLKSRDSQEKEEKEEKVEQLDEVNFFYWLNELSKKHKMMVWCAFTKESWRSLSDKRKQNGVRAGGERHAFLLYSQQKIKED